MSILEIIILVSCIWFAIVLTGIFAFHIYKTRIKFKAEIIKGHRDLWIFYHENYKDFKDIFDNNSQPEELNEKQSMFLVMLFNQMELVYNTKRYDMLPRTFDYVEDFKNIMSYNIIKKFWKGNRFYRDKSFAKFIDKIINEKK